jgi:hypothetical protein
VPETPRIDPVIMKPPSAADLAFTFRRGKDESVTISRDNRLVTILRGRSAQRFLLKAAAASPAAQQQLMARATGNYKRGNERVAIDASQAVDVRNT